MSKPITYNRKTYASLKEFATEYNINYSTVRDKISKGKSIDDIVRTSKKYNQTKPIIDPLTNITYPSTKAFCKAYNLDPTNYRRLLNNGYTLKEICESRLNNYVISSGPIIDPFGNKFRSKTEMCAFHNKTYKQVYSRLAKGKTLKEALTEPTCETITSKLITYNGKTYKSIRNLCRKLNLNYGIVKNKIYRGMPIEIAVETSINSSLPSKKLPKSFKKIKIAYTHNNIDYYECIHNNQKYILSIPEMKELSKTEKENG